MSNDFPDVVVFPPTVRELGDPRERQATWLLMPAPPGVCSQCAVDHEPDVPHNPQSLRYQYAFYAERGRWPDWEDAMSHCSDDVHESWRVLLAEHGVHVAPRGEDVRDE